MKNSPVFRWSLLTFVAFFLAFFVLSMSFMRFQLYTPSLDELEKRSKISFANRFVELTTFPFLPDHPLYPIQGFSDRVLLITARDDQKAMVKLQLANKRLVYAETLLSRGRRALALTTLTKAEKYVLSAAADIQVQAYNESSSQLLENTVGVHLSRINAMKSAFNDTERSVVDTLLLQLFVVENKKS